MASNDPKSRLEGTTNSPPYVSPNGVTEQRGTPGTTSPESSASRKDTGRQADESAGEKIGRFFRKAMDRLSGHDEDDWRRGNDRNQRDRETQERYAEGDRSAQYGRSALRDRSQKEWSDLGRNRDDRNVTYRGGPPGDTGGSYERLQTGSASVGYGQGTTGRPYGQGQGTYRQSSFGGQGGYERDASRFGAGQPQGGPSFENRGGQSYGQSALGRSPSESHGLGETQGEGRRDEWNREEWSRGEPSGSDWNRDRWGQRSGQSGAAGMSGSYGASSGSFGFGRDEERAGEWGETARDRDQGQGRRFWQREPLAARDVMTRSPKTVTRQSPHREAAIIMREENCGVVPVVDEAGRLQGILTDRDIVVRGTVNDRAHEMRVQDIMTDDVSAVTEDEPLTSVLDLMGRRQIRRVPVVDREDRLLGIISMADIANRADYDEDLQDAFERISSRRSFWSLFS